jgi:hypothetical protein
MNSMHPLPFGFKASKNLKAASRVIGSEARRAQDGLDTHSLRKLNALRHTCQFKFQSG